MNQQIEDKIVLRVLARFNERSQVGINKYNTTLERTDLSTLEWLNHAPEKRITVLSFERNEDKEIEMLDRLKWATEYYDEYYSLLEAK